MLECICDRQEKLPQYHAERCPVYAEWLEYDKQQSLMDGLQRQILELKQECRELKKFMIHMHEDQAKMKKEIILLKVSLSMD